MFPSLAFRSGAARTYRVQRLSVRIAAGRRRRRPVRSVKRALWSYAMDEVYFRHVRRDIDRLLPTSAQRILDVGSGVGATSVWLKSRYPGCTTVALEGNADIREELARNVDEAVILDLNGQIPDVGAPDLVLCLDVLEHLMEPLEVLKRVTSTMA